MVSKLAKGEITRMNILDTARTTFNEKGINLTLDNLAAEMDVPKGRITNHFSTKDKLFLAILNDYEEHLTALFHTLADLYVSKKLEASREILSRVMDLQYEYRCAIIYLNVLTPGQLELRQHIGSQAEKRIETVRFRITTMVKNKLLREDILEKRNFESFLFIYINQLTQWVVYHDMYAQHLGYQAMKPIYLKGIMIHVYGPYLTPKGKKELQELDF